MHRTQTTKERNRIYTTEAFSQTLNRTELNEVRGERRGRGVVLITLSDNSGMEGLGHALDNLVKEDWKARYPIRVVVLWGHEDLLSVSMTSFLHLPE